MHSCNNDDDGDDGGGGGDDDDDRFPYVSISKPFPVVLQYRVNTPDQPDQPRHPYFPENSFIPTFPAGGSSKTRNKWITN